MSSGPLLFLGVFAAMASSFWALVLAPQLQIGRQEVRALPLTGELYPSARPGLAQAGAEVYRAQGCVECHSQQVRGLGSDVARGLGKRITVAQDYLHDYPVLLGQVRLGPDLANISARQADASWHLKHLYDPRCVVPGSMMPRYPYLFEKRPLPAGGKPSPDALPLDDATKAGYEIIPKDDAHALVAYLLSLKSETPLFEAPIPQPKTNAAPAAAGTNAPAAAPAAP